MSRTSPKNKKLVDQFYSKISDSNIQVYKFEIESLTLRSLFDYDPFDYENTSMVSTLSSYIDRFNQIPQNKKDEFLKSPTYDWYESLDAELYQCYQLFKILWLCRDIKLNGQQAPIQFFKTLDTYLCHPGSDKRYAVTLLEPIPVIKGFYIHYPELDPEISLPAAMSTVDSADDFVGMFEKAHEHSFNFEVGDVYLDNDDFKSSGHFAPFARESQLVLKKRTGMDQMTIPHISYRDSVHREKMLESIHIISEIYQESDSVFHLGEYTFHKVSGHWIPEVVLNYPQSIIDNNYVWQEQKALRIGK